MTGKRNILVIKHGALGDIIQALDGFASLRAGHGADHLAILTTPAFAEFIAMMPYFDEILPDHRAGFYNLPEYLRVRKILKRPWHRVYDFQSSRRSRHYLDRLVHDDAEIIGHSSRATHSLPDMTGVNNAERMLRTAMLGGCPRVRCDLSWLAGKDRAGKKEKSGRVVFVPGCSRKKLQKRWPPEHFARLGAMMEAKGHSITLVGTAADSDAAEAICAALPGTENLTGRTTLAELAKIFARAALVVGNDTGPVFLAARTGVPTLMLMSGHTDPAMSAPVGARAHWLRENDIAAITPDAAFDAAMELCYKK